MKSIIKAMTLSLGMAVLLSFASCSNGSSGNDDVNQNSNSNAIVENQSITFTENLSELISAAEFTEIENISALTIITKNYTAAGSNDWWISIASDESWTNTISLKEKGEWSDTNNGWKYTLSGETLTAYLASGLFIAGPDGDSSTVSVYYTVTEE